MRENINVSRQLKISLPIAFENLINVLMTLIDTLVVSVLGTSHIGAMGAMTVVIGIMQMSMQTINVTNCTLIAKAIGQNDNNSIKCFSGNSIILSLIIGILTIFIIYIIKPIFPVMFNVDEICNVYLSIRLIGFIPNSFVTILSGQQRTLGKQRSILLLRIIVVILNLIFDIIVVKYGYGIEGVAWVTVMLDCFIALVLFIKANNTISYKINKEAIKTIFDLFKWNYIERIVSKIDNFVFNILVSRIGEIEYAVHVILIQIKDIVEAFTQGFGDGITISVGIASGKKDVNYMNEVKIVAKKIINIVSVIIPIATALISISIMYISLNELLLQKIFFSVLPILLISVYTITSATYYFSIIRGIRDFEFLAKRNLISSFIKIVIATILAYTPLGIIGVWVSYFVYTLSQKYMSKFRYMKIINK